MNIPNTINNAKYLAKEAGKVSAKVIWGILLTCIILGFASYKAYQKFGPVVKELLVKEVQSRLEGIEDNQHKHSNEFQILKQNDKAQNVKLDNLEVKQIQQEENLDFTIRMSNRLSKDEILEEVRRRNERIEVVRPLTVDTLSSNVSHKKNTIDLIFAKK